MREERIIRRRKTKDHEGVLDDRINGKTVELADEFKHIEHKVKNYEMSLAKNSNTMKSLVMAIAEVDKSEQRRNSRVLDADKAEKVEKKIHKALEKSVGKEKSKQMAKKFIFQAKEYGIDKASDNLVKEVAQKSARHSGRKVGAFARKTGSLSRSTNRSAIRKIKREDKAERRVDEVKKEAIRIGGKEGRQLASIINKEMVKSKGNRDAVSKKVEKIKSKESPEKRFEKAVEKQIRMSGVRDMAVRRLRRTARKLRSASRTIQEIDRANNGIEMNARGDEAARGLQSMINNVLHYADRGEEISGRSVSSAKADRQTMMIDALLQKGRASMMAATRRTNVMRKSLVKEQQLDQERVRS